MRINCFVLCNSLPAPSFAPKTWPTIARAEIVYIYIGIYVSSSLLFSLVLTIFNPGDRIGRHRKFNTDVMSKCRPTHFVRFRANPFPQPPTHRQFLYANLLITQRKHIGQVRCSLPRVFRIFLSFSSHSVDSKCLPKLCGDGEIAENSALPYKIITGCMYASVRRMKQFACHKTLVHSSYFYVDDK